MTVRFISFSTDDDHPPWTHCNQDLFGDWRANFYNTNEPYLRHSRMLSACGPNARQHIGEMKSQVEVRAAADDLVTFDRLPEEIQRYWAESDAAWLVADIVRHVKERRRG